MDSSFIRAAQSANALRLQDHIDLLSMFTPEVARMRAQQMHIDEMKHLTAIEIRNRFVPVTPGRKPLWAKLQEEEYMNLELLARAGLGSPEEIFHKIKRECERPQSIVREPAIPRNIFREFYYKVINL